jgi:hypothetical protein
MDLDVERADVAEESLNRLIERRAAEAQEQERVERSWAESAHTLNLRAQAEIRREWAQYHLGMRRLHTQLAEEYQEKAARLIDSEAGGVRS